MRHIDKVNRAKEAIHEVFSDLQDAGPQIVFDSLRDLRCQVEILMDDLPSYLREEG